MGAAELGQNAIQFSDLMRLGCLIRIEMSPVDLEYFLSAKRPTSDAVLVPGNTGASLGHPTRRFCGILTRRERWGLSGRGWLVLTLLACAGILAVLHGIYPFLAVTRTVEAPVLVVEGWIIKGVPINAYSPRVAPSPEAQTTRSDPKPMPIEAREFSINPGSPKNRCRWFHPALRIGTEPTVRPWPCVIGFGFMSPGCAPLI